MDPERDLDITNARAFIELWKDEERRLREMIADAQTSPEVRKQANDKLIVVLEQINDAARELTEMEPGR